MRAVSASKNQKRFFAPSFALVRADCTVLIRSAVWS